MRPVVLALSMALPVLADCARPQQRDRNIRGLLNDHGAITLSECGKGKVDWVRAADTLSFSLMRRIQDLSGQSDAGILGELRGETIDVATWLRVPHPVHGTLWLSRIVSVEPGDC